MMRESLETWLADWTMKEFEISADQLDRSRPFMTYGMNSVQAMILVGDLESQVNLHLPPTLIWDYPTFDALVEHLLIKIAESNSKPSAVKEAPVLSAVANSSILKEDPQAILEKLDDLSEAELDALLELYLAAPATASTK